MPKAATMPEDKSVNTADQNMPGLTRFESRATLENHLCDQVVELLQAGIDNRGQASIAVSGGRTPTAFFQQLASRPLDWAKVTVVLVDERWVAPDHEDSNERLVRLNLLQGEAAGARFIGHKTAAISAAEAIGELQQRLEALPSVLDVVILGMGEDGHTASFFPGAQTLPESLSPAPGRDCQSVTPVDAAHERMTLTLPRLLASRHVFLHLCGDSKLPVLAEANRSGPVEAMPVRAFLRQQQTPLSILWAP